MNNLTFKYLKCDDIIDEFGEKKLEDRFNTLLKEMEEFISKSNFNEKVKVNRIILANVIIDYFYDIKRLKNFHTDINKINSEKVIAYTAYWLLQRKALQIVDNESFDKELATINERFVLQYVLDYLSERERKCHILLRTNKGLKNFASLLLYYFIYRKYDAQSIEMLISAFMAGQIYEQVDEDISGKLHPFDC